MSIHGCYMWTREILKDGSNILKFQKLFDVIDVDYKEREAQWRIFTKIAEDSKDYAERTSLQCAAKQYLIQGRSLGNGFGVLRKW